MDQALIEEIRQANNIVDVVGSYIPLKRSGSSFKAQCPFHDDSHPSMMISDKKQIFKCFVCGKGGNAITFVQEYEHISFIEAVKKLAERAGITVAEEKKKTKVIKTKNQLMLQVYDDAKRYFVNNLNKFGEEVIVYLEKRGITRDAIKNYDIGYALDSFNGLKNHLLNKHYGADILKASGLFGSNNNGHYDLFRERLIFPIHSSSGKVVAFGGRKLNEEQMGGKYINSPTTDIYTKGKELYGFFLTKFDIGKMDYAIICEGYMDFLRLYSTGYTNSVASLGTALTDDQLKILKQFTKKLYMAYDGDDAGMKAALRGSLIALGFGYKVNIIELPEGEDPDSYLLKFGKESFDDLIDKALPFIDFYSSSPKIKLDKKTRIDELLQVLNTISDEIAKDLLVKEISESFKVKESSIRVGLKKNRPRFRTDVKKSREPFSVSKYTEEKFVLILAIHSKLYEHILEELDETYFYVEKYKRLFKFIEKNYERVIEISTPSAILNLTEDEDIRNELSELIYEDSPSTDIDKFITEMKHRKLLEELIIVSDQLLQSPDNQELYKKKKEIRTQIRLLGAQVIGKTLH